MLFRSVSLRIKVELLKAGIPEKPESSHAAGSPVAGSPSDSALTGGQNNLSPTLLKMGKVDNPLYVEIKSEEEVSTIREYVLINKHQINYAKRLIGKHLINGVECPHEIIVCEENMGEGYDYYQCSSCRSNHLVSHKETGEIKICQEKQQDQEAVDQKPNSDASSANSTNLPKRKFKRKLPSTTE